MGVVEVAGPKLEDYWAAVDIDRLGGRMWGISLLDKQKACNYKLGMMGFDSVDNFCNLVIV